MWKAHHAQVINYALSACHLTNSHGPMSSLTSHITLYHLTSHCHIKCHISCMCHLIMPLDRDAWSHVMTHHHLRLPPHHCHLTNSTPCNHIKLPLHITTSPFPPHHATSHFNLIEEPYLCHIIIALISAILATR